MKTKEHIKIGDTVRLKSGGGDMSIDGIRHNGRVVCVWFDEDNKVRRAIFAADTLEVQGLRQMR